MKRMLGCRRTAMRQSGTKSGRLAQKERAASARAQALAAKAWSSDVAICSKGTSWSAASSWIEQSDATHCAEFVHKSTGKAQVIKLRGLSTSAERREALTRQLA